MDDEDVYGIPSDYYRSEETFRHRPEDVPTSSLDELLDDALARGSFEDFGEWSWNPSPKPSPPFRGPPGTGREPFLGDTAAHREPGQNFQRLSGARPQSNSREFGISVAYHDQGSPFREPRGSHFENIPVRNTHQDRVSIHAPQFGGAVQRGAPDTFPAPVQEGAPRSSGSIRLRQVSELPDMYRSMFKFGVFNAMQSSCFDTIMKSGENLTVLFELSIIHMLINSSGGGAAEKCVYVAPTKALCAERARDWTEKFGPLGIKCSEMTGDTVQPSRSVWGEFKNANIMLGAEKWDSLTRSWSNHSQLLSQIRLFLIDEVHILNELRGSTLEVVVCRMKKRGSAVRFVAVSATVPNIDDVAHWIASRYSNSAAVAFQFGEEYRPCQLSRFVYGFPRGKNQNDFLFAQSLNYRLFPLLQQHSANKPILIFVSTRKGVLSTAEQLMADYNKAVERNHRLPWSLPTKIEKTFVNKQLEKLAAAGIGAHHAGLELSDKRVVEELFLNKVLRVVVATSTLAVGVNLPAHTVVIKDVRLFQNGASQEYSDLDIMQMIGRAGRPQFDKEGVAIIMCESGLESKYRALGCGQTILESSLHTNLTEHLNSEVGLGTITNMETAKEWIRHSFMFRRLGQNPHRYMPQGQPWKDGLNGMISKCFNDLKKAELLTYVDEKSGELRSTEFGEIMSKFYLRQATMASIMSLPVKATLRDMLEALATSEEFSELKMRAGDKQASTSIHMSSHDDIRFRIGRVEKTADKVFLLIQAALGRISLHTAEYKFGESNALLDSIVVFRHASRIARAMVEVAISKKIGAQIKHGLELARNISAKVWEDRPTILAERGITNFEKLRGQDPIQLDLLLNKKQASGHKILFAVRELPQYSVAIHEMAVTRTTVSGGSAVTVKADIQCSVSLECVTSKSKTQKSGHYRDMTYILTVTSDLEFIDFRRIPTKALQDSKSFSVTAQLTKPSQSIWVHLSSDAIAGVTISSQYKPRINTDLFPVMDTRPKTNMEIELEGLEGNEEFWNMELSDDEIPIKESTLKLAHDTTKDGREAISPSSLSAEKQAEFFTNAEKLPNGKYRCNHPCKDKSACGHLCCRDGVKKPSLAPKRRSVGLQLGTDSSVKKRARQATDKDSAPGSKSSSLVKASSRHLSASLRQLEVIHKGSGTDSHLRIPDGKRIKLLHGPPSGDVQLAPNITKKWPKFDIGLSVLEEDDDMTGQTSPIEISDSDDFPDAREIVRASVRSAGQSLASRVSDYSDPDVDALICDTVLDGMSSTGIDTTKTQDVSGPSTTHREEFCAVTMTKQTKATSSTGNISPRSRRQKGQLDIEAPSRLFVSDSDSGFDGLNSISAVTDLSAGPEDFVLDKSLFDVPGSEATRDPPVAPLICRSPSPTKSHHLPTLDSEEPSFYAAWKNEQRKKYGEDWNPPEHNYLVDFEEWLAATDSIEFVD
ncbi:P-loop containing nucleoside triphosphate hydrolase protein [Russula earlei]|uniref:P-loop containing nucleoside triphosphate hydrolase protein n=1 Tax=Russula earlei TaxID=71964 RepID=A0ACC0U541_9AGAM|nr:P-loop containing nucleoside triphosphate hydrolase protein [Russula earlei]